MLSWLFAAAVASAPFPHDGFVYPGQPGSAGVERYLKDWDAWAGRTQAASKAPSRLEADLGWLRGRWTVQVREFDAKAGPSPAAEGTAVAGLTEDGRWLRLETRAGPFSWTRHLGYDPFGRRFVLVELWSPGAGPVEPAYAPGWRGERLVFGPYRIDWRGLKLRDRLTLVREGPDRFRLVTEAVLPNGRAVAVDDAVFTRARGD